MLRDKIVRLLEEAVAEAQQNGVIPAVALPEITVEHPQDAYRGDYACSFALKMARAARANPMNIAREMICLIAPVEEIDKIEAAPPGFINFTLKDSWLAQHVQRILDDGADYGNIDCGKGSRVQVEFVSVNPTGPLHVGHGRGAVLGSTLANVLAASGYSVEKEYYINDAGGQIDAFRSSLHARYQQALGGVTEVPANGYHGDYLIDIANEIVAEHGSSFLNLSVEDSVREVGNIGYQKVVDSIKVDLELLRVSFDTWFSEKSLYDGPEFDHVMALLRERGYTAEKEGATWFTSSTLGEDKDNVLIRSTGVPTYFASDIAYHYNKLHGRKFDKAINIWGADHQGHVPRLKVAMEATDIEPDRLQVIITQMVSLKRDEVGLKLSKRSGNLVALRDVVEDVGVDACRFFFISRSANSQMEFDLDLAKKQSAENPVYYVQYAHARICSILRLAQERNIDYGDGDVALLTGDPELKLVRKLIELPEVIEAVESTLEPVFLPYYAQDVATAFHNFYERCRVVSDDEEQTKARLKLVKAVSIVLAKVLNLMGMTAPEKM